MFCWTVYLNGGARGCNYATVEVEHKVYAFGELNYGNTAQMDVHVFNTVSLSWSTLTLCSLLKCRFQITVPRTREGHTAVLIEDTIYIWGGFPYHNILYAFDVDTHRIFEPQVSGTVPAARYEHSACVLGKVMFIYGGNTHLTNHSIDIYKLDTTTMVWSLINTRGIQPPASYRHSATIIGTKMFLIGGQEGYWGDQYSNMRVFDIDTNCWLSTQPLPEKRSSHSSFTYNGELYIFVDYTFQYLWKFNPDTFSWKKVETKGEGPRARGMCCCMVGDRIILFGGYNNQTNNLFVLDLSPGLKTLCKIAVIQYGLEQSELPHNIRWELAAMKNIKYH